MRAFVSGVSPSAVGIALGFALLASLGGCTSFAPPRSPLPDAKSAVARLDATYAGVTGIRGTAQIDYRGSTGRVRGELRLLASGPDKLRIGIKANVVGSAGEVSSDGLRFWAEDKANNRFVTGLAKPCNIARITQVPLASRELVPMLWGARPDLPQKVTCDSVKWNKDEGHYVVALGHDAAPGEPKLHELHLAPWPEDLDKPWSEQRMRLFGVLAWRDDQLVYRVTMDDHRKTSTAPAMVDPDGLSDDVPPSGPNVTVDVPRKIHVEVPGKKSDVVFKYDEAVLNPPLPKDVFKLYIPPGVPVEEATCD